MRPKNSLDSFKFAIEGIVHVFRTQRHMRIHFVMVALVLLIGLLFKIERRDMIVLLFTMTLVLMAEMFNTAVEAVVDLVTQTYHPLAKFAKDIAAGAVLISTINAVIVGFLIFVNYDIARVRLRLGTHTPDLLMILIVMAVMIFVVLTISKILGGKGTLLQGGVVSGHSATGFFFAMTIVFLSQNLLVAILAILLALLVAQSRVEAGIHSLQEVVLGGLLAIFLTGLIYNVSFEAPRRDRPAVTAPVEGVVTP